MKKELLHTVKKDSIFTKIKKIFIAKSIEIETFKDDNLENNSVEEEKNKFVENIKISDTELNEIQRKCDKNKFIKQLENDTSLFESLSIERLEKLNNYYDDLIEKEKLKLEKLTAN